MTNKNDLELTDPLTLEQGATGVETEDFSGVEITEPFNPEAIRVEPRPTVVHLIIERILHGEINLEPGYQRKAGIWSDEAQSRLIESLLIRIPLPAFYMDASNEDSWEIIDGLQRLTALKRFILDKTLTLHGLEFLTDYNGKTFDELPRNFQRRIEETSLVVYLLEKGTPEKVKFNIFKRINTGGLPLSAQEIRHALNPGRAPVFLEQLSKERWFKKATDNSIRDDRMADREIILRFIAFLLTPFDKYTKKETLDIFLNKAMSTLNNISEDRIQELKQRFVQSMKASFEIFGRHAFRKRYDLDSGQRFPINKPLFEAISVNLDKIDNSEIKYLKANKDRVNQQLVHLMSNNEEFLSSITSATGQEKSVKIRFEKVGEVFRSVLDD